MKEKTTFHDKPTGAAADPNVKQVREQRIQEKLAAANGYITHVERALESMRGVLFGEANDGPEECEPDSQSIEGLAHDLSRRTASLVAEISSIVARL